MLAPTLALNGADAGAPPTAFMITCTGPGSIEPLVRTTTRVGEADHM